MPDRQHEATKSTHTRPTVTVRQQPAQHAELQPDPTRLAMSIADAAIALGVSRRHVEKLAKLGDIPSILLGRRRLVPLAALTKLLEGDQ